MLLLSFCNDYESKKLIGNYISNYLYNNITSAKSIDDEFLSLTYHSIQHEVKNITKENIPALFLDSGVNTFILKNILHRPKVNSSLLPIFTMILQEINDIPFEMTCELKNLIAVNVTENDTRDLLIEKDTVSGKYMIPLDKDALLSEKESQSDERMKEYIDIHIKECEEYKNGKLFVGEVFLDKIFAVPDYNEVTSQDVLDRYCYHVRQIATVVVKIVRILKENYDIIPLPVRQICKMISIAIRKKFKEISQVRVNAFVSRFFIDIIFDEFLSVPNRYKLIKKANLSDNIEKNKNIVFKVLHYLFMGYFFDVKMNQNFSLFNWVFIHIMPDVLALFDKIIDVDRPSIDIDNFDFYKENETNMKVSVIPYTAELVLAIAELLSKNGKEIQSELSVTDSMKTFQFIKLIENNKKKLMKIKQGDKDAKKLSFFILNSIEYSDEFYLSIPEKYMNIKIQDEIKEKVIDLCWKIKHNRIDISQCEDKSTLGCVRYLMRMSQVGMFPKEEFTSLLKLRDSLEKIKIDFKSFYQNIIQQMKSKIDAIVYENKKRAIRTIKHNIDDINKEITFYKTRQIEKEILTILDYVIIEMRLNNKEYFYDYDKQFQEVINNKWYDHIEFKVGDFTSKSLRDYYYNAGYYTINQFIELFPNFATTEKVFECIKSNHINQFLSRLFQAFNDGLSKVIVIVQLLTYQDQIQLYAEYIKNFIISKIYYKIYPLKPLPTDISLHQNTVNNSWVTLSMMTGKEIDVDVFIPSVRSQIQSLSQSKTFNDKADSISKLISLLREYLNENENINIYLLYLINKVKPYRLYSDVEYLSKFNNEENKETTLNIQMMTYCMNLLLNMNEEDLKNFDTPQGKI